MDQDMTQDTAQDMVQDIAQDMVQDMVSHNGLSNLAPQPAHKHGYQLPQHTQQTLHHHCAHILAHDTI